MHESAFLFAPSYTVMDQVKGRSDYARLFLLLKFQVLFLSVNCECLCTGKSRQRRPDAFFKPPNK